MISENNDGKNICCVLGLRRRRKDDDRAFAGGQCRKAGQADDSARRFEAALYKAPKYENLRFACASLYDDVPVTELTSTMLALHSLCDVLVIDCQTGHFAMGRELLGRDDVRVIVTRPDDASIRASERMMTKAGIGMEERRLVVNRATAQRVRKKAQYDAKTVEMTLDCPLAGCIPEDDSVAACSQKGRIALECDGPARRALAQLTDALLDEAK